MDPQSAVFTPRDDIWRVQTDMLRVQQVQADHGERLNRLERRQDEDARVRSVWGTSSPFPGVLSGTPQSGPVQHSTADGFAGFDDTQSALLGGLHLDADDEPRRMGTTSRANSVRFDESANQGHWAQASRSSIDIIPRVGSGLGHPMTERSFSHKSDGRQSSAGQSVHSMASGRANSLGIDTSYGVVHSNTSPVEPPGLVPGLFILGPVPAIIRCWLTTSFKHDSLLYAAVCTGSYTSFLDSRLVERLGFQARVMQNEEVRTIKLPMFLPEAIQHLPSSRSSSPAPQLPSLTVDFTVIETSFEEVDSKAIQIFLGSDTLRAHNADILLSSNKLILFDDDQGRLSIPLVRPEDERTFKNLQVTSCSNKIGQQAKGSAHYGVREELSTRESTSSPDIRPGSDAQSHALPPVSKDASSTPPGHDREQHSTAMTESVSSETADTRVAPHREIPAPLDTKQDSVGDSESNFPSGGDSARSGPPSAIWSNWRREGDRGGPAEWAKKGAPLSYHRRDQGMKVLKPAKSTMRSLSGSHSSSTSSIPGQSRAFDDAKRGSSFSLGNIGDAAETTGKRPGSVEAKGNGSLKDSTQGSGRSRSTNPVGGASAFAWLKAETK